MDDTLPLADWLRRESHRVCTLILNTDMAWFDIALQIERMRERCAAEAPDKLDLFEAVYESRFRRLWDQWRQPIEDKRPW